jgi:hypothetical protein
MSRWRTLVAFVVLALWMPATSHCALEAAGVLEVGDCCDADHDAEPDTESCSPIDRTLTMSSSDLVAATPSYFFAYSLPNAILPADLEPVAHFPGYVRDEPEDWLTSWAFESRAALPARAPSTRV